MYRLAVHVDSRVHEAGLIRISAAHSNPTNVALGALLASLSHNVYAKVRARAQFLFSLMCTRQPRAAVQLVPQVIQRLSDASAPEAVIKGAVYTLANDAVAKRVARSEVLFPSFAKAVMSLDARELKSSLFARIQELFLTVVSKVPGSATVRLSSPSSAHLRYQGPESISSPLVTDARLKDADAWHRRTHALSASRRSAFAQEIAGEIAASSTASAQATDHWRHRVMALGNLLLTLRPGGTLPAPVLQAFCKGAIDDVSQVSHDCTQQMYIYI